MSLRTFHLFFIVISALLCLVVSFWAYRENQTVYLVGGTVGFVSLVFYLRWFFDKYKAHV